LIVSLSSAGVVVWDAFLRRSRFDVKADWIISTDEPVLRIVILNVGWRKDTVVDVRLKERAMPRGRGWTPLASVMSQLPVILDVDEASPAFELAASSGGDSFDDALRCDRIEELEVENARGRIDVFALPALYRAKDNAERNIEPHIQKGTAA
jgi:hypothetical protein